MTRVERIQLAIDKGYTYNSVTGKIYNKFNKEIKCKETVGYIQISLYNENLKQYKLKGHQFAWYYINNEVVKCLDHINGDRSDNRICNLRSVTHQENRFNIKSKGYCLNKRINKFVAYIKLDGKSIHLGYFELESDAKNAYLNAKKIYHII